ncbi:Suppressor of tumorigenicity 7 protein-like protein, partial [Nibea albiflora]
SFCVFSTVSMFLNTLTPKFYVALTGTSSLISGLILIFEWWYFRKYGTSFIEQVSVSHLRPLLGGVDSSSPSNSNTSNGEADSNRQSVSVMQKAWRERNPQARISAAHEALELEDCATAYILLAEEEATTIMEAERLFKQALKAGESCYRRSQQLQHHGTQYEAQHRRDTNLMKEFPLLSMFNIHENLLESLLELQNYADVQAVLAKYDAEMNAVEAIHRAVEFNPHVPKYLLEMKSLILPPEHILKRGDSEAIAYAFFHLQHWKRVEGALNLLHCTWEGISQHAVCSPELHHGEGGEHPAVQPLAPTHPHLTPRPNRTRIRPRTRS